MKFTDKTSLDWAAYYHGTIEPVYNVSVFKDFALLDLEGLFGSEKESLDLINNIAALTSSEQNVRPILFSNVESENFSGESCPYYFCKNEDESIEILSHKIELFMRATQESSSEIAFKIGTFGTQKSCVKWTFIQEINSFSTLQKIHHHVPKPILNNQDNAGLYCETHNFLASGVLLTYHIANFTEENTPSYFRFVWSSEQNRIIGKFTTGPFIPFTSTA